MVLAADPLKIPVRADNKKLKRDVKQSKKLVGSIGGGLGGGFANLLAGAGILAAVKGVRSMVDEIIDLSTQLNVSVEELQKWREVATRFGVDVQKLPKLFIDLNKKILDADRGLSTSLKTFKDLNVDIKELKKLRPDQQFLAIAKAFQKIEKNSRLGLATELFGGKGSTALRIINQGMEQINKARREALNLSAEDLANLKSASDELAVFNQRLKVRATLGVATLLSPKKTFKEVIGKDIRNLFTGEASGRGRETGRSVNPKVSVFQLGRTEVENQARRDNKEPN